MGLERKRKMRISGRGQGIHEGPETGVGGLGEEKVLKNKSTNIQMFSQVHSEVYTRIFRGYWLNKL